jgi:acetyltransferase-like isoleucine patch superfamily enzyme
MLRNSIAELKQWAKRRETPLARLVYSTAKLTRHASIPSIPGVHGVLYAAHVNTRGLLATLARACWYTPLFQSRLERPAPRLYLYGGMPVVIGPLAIVLGSDCRVAGMMTISGRSSARETPRLIVGDNVDLGWGSTISVGRQILIGNNVRLAQGVLLIGYPGHPIEPEARARGEPETDDQVGDIVLEDDVWLGSRVVVLPGVRIGRGTIVGAGSVVTKDLPPMSLAAGAPAQVRRSIRDDADRKHLAG